MKRGVGNDRMRMFVCFACFAAGFFAGCSNSVSLSDGPVTGSRVLVVQIAGESPGGRTALPPAPAPAAYTISVNRGAAGLGRSTFTAGAGPYPVELTDDPAAGDAVQVEGFDGGGVKNAGGSYTLTDDNINGTPVSVTLYPLTEGTGDVSLSVSFVRNSPDGEITAAELSLYQNLAAYKAKNVYRDKRYRKDGSYGEGADFTGPSPEIIPIEYIDLPSGDYVVMIEFFRGAPGSLIKVSRLVQTIIVRGGLTTGIWDNSGSSVLAWNAFASSNADLDPAAGIKIDGKVIAGYNPAAPIYNIYEPTTSIPVNKTLTLTIGEPGQTVTVGLNKAADIPLTSGEAYTFAELEAMGSGSPGLENTLIITVTAPDGISEKSYTVNLSGKEIIDFYFDIGGKYYGVKTGTGNLVTGSGNISGTSITITVPYGTDMTTLTPAIRHSGTSIDPEPGAPKDFTSPVIYTVRAADDSTRDYTVTVNEPSGITISAITVKGLDVLTFSGVPPLPGDPEWIVDRFTEITIRISGDVTVSDWYVEMNGPINGPIDPIRSTENTVTFSAPPVLGFYNVNVFARAGDVDYLGSFGLIVK